MASTDPNSDLVLAGQAPLSDLDVEQLNYEIMLERAIVNSLEELPDDPDTRQRITDSDARVRELQTQLSVARRAQPQHPGTCPLLPWLHHRH